ncbi:MAG TPA: hypothetical protein VKG63_06770 [Steroidobacteraceae bacterium]|nr:hypothetical protein [Steroidobacteraceae bacterium]
MNTRLRLIFPIAALAAISGCNSTPLTTTKQPMALDFALKRARFEMSCPEATGSVLSSETIQPPNVGPRFQGPQRAQFTIGVAGCGKRETMVVICADGSDGCFAAEGR